jgi:hypothetical protein
MSSPAWRMVLAAPDGALLQTLADHFRPILAQAPNGPELLAVQSPDQLPPDMDPTPVWLMADGPPEAVAHWRTWLHQREWPYQVVYSTGSEGLTKLAHALAADDWSTAAWTQTVSRARAASQAAKTIAVNAAASAVVNAAAHHPPSFSSHRGDPRVRALSSCSTKIGFRR